MFYVRKILLDKVPDRCIKIVTQHIDRLGLTLEVPVKRNSSKLLIDSCSVRGPVTFNSLPKDLRNADKTMDSLKVKLNEFLSIILAHQGLIMMEEATPTPLRPKSVAGG